jgi:hypothetical protein
MPYPNEHAARVIEPGTCDSFKRMNQGSGVSLILCIKGGKSSAQAYRFDKTKFTPEQAKKWLKDHKIKPISFEAASESKDVTAKVSMTASKSLDGKIWSSGLHHVFVNDKPARVYVPETTIIETFNNMKETIAAEGSIGLGIDHLSNDILDDNDILRKLNLLDVGAVSSIVTDGSGIFIRESNITNDAIRNLHDQGELPAYSIVGGMDAKPCPSGKADYVVDHIDVERIDIVGEGGCESCKVGVQPSNIILTAKLSSKEELDMVEANEAPIKEAVEEVVDETVPEEVAEEVVEEVKAKEEVEEVTAVEEELSELDIVKKELAELKDMLGGKKPKVEASKSDFDIEGEISKLIHAGKATPAMKEMLTKVAEQSEDAFHAMAASMPKFVSMKMESKLAKIEEEVKKPKKTPEEEWESEYGEMARRFRV